MKSYKCSKCALLLDNDEYCYCLADIDIRPGHREKGDVEICENNFIPLEEKQQWHEKFNWE